MIEPRRLTEDYRLDKLLRSSASGSVFRAADLRSGATVIVKVIAEGGDDSVEQREGFLRAAQALRALQHPSLPRVLDFGFTTAGSAFLVTESLEGAGLGEPAGTNPSRALALLLQIVDGLAALEAAGIAHRNLRDDNLLVVPGAQGEQVKLLGIGGAALGLGPSPAGLEEGRRQDLRDLAAIARRMLGAGRPPGAVQPLLDAMQSPGPAMPPSYAEIRRVLSLPMTPGLAGGADTIPITDMAGIERRARERALQAVKPPDPEVPVSVAPPPPPLAEARRTIDFPQPVDKRPRRGLLVGGGILAVLLAATVALFSIRPRVPAGEPKAEPAPAAETPAPPLPAPTAPKEEPQPTTPPVPPQIVRAETLLAAGDPGAAKDALATIPAAEKDALTGEARERYQRLTAALAQTEHPSLAGELGADLGSGDLARLRSAVASVRPAERKSLPPSVRKDLDRAVKALEADARLTRAQQEGGHEKVVEEAATLLALVPHSSRAREARDFAAAALDAEADAAIAAGRLDAALQSLESLRRGWPDRPGLATRIAQVEADRKDDQRLESLLADVAREAKANGPQSALRLLTGTPPNPRFAERFRQAKAGLEAQIAGLDRTPPVLAIPAAWEAAYDKGESVKVPLLVSDEHAIASVELWARPEGGRFEKVPVRHVTGAQYVAEILPALHQNKTVELYATASDASGNQGQLGSADNPRKIKRKKWYEKLIPGKSGG